MARKPTPPDDDWTDWRPQADAEILARAEEIKGDTRRHKRAQVRASREAARLERVAAGVEKVPVKKTVQFSANARRPRRHRRP